VTLLEPTASAPATRSVTAARDRDVVAPRPASLVRPSILYALLFGSVGAYVPYISMYFADIGLGLETIGLLSAIAAAVGLVAAPAWGAVADRSRDVRVPLLIGALWASAAAAWLGTATAPLTVALAMAALAAGTAGLAPMLDSRTVAILGADRDRFGRARAWGSAAFIVTALGVGQLIDRLGTEALVLVWVPALALTGIAAFVLLRGGPQRARAARALGSGSALLAMLRSRELGSFFLLSVLLWTAVSAVMTFASIHLVALGGDGAMVGALWALGAFIEVPLMFTFPVLVRRTGPEPLVVIGAVAYGLRALGWALAPSPIVLVALAPIGGVGFAFVYVGTVMVIARRVPASSQATAQGLFSGTTFSLGSIIGAVLGGQLAQATSIPVLFVVSAAIAMASALGIWLAIGRGSMRGTAAARA
jgi:MFS transporter, PPP family, 3-phenylpropionic acid transporter